jgi:hypothetical protein
MRISILLFFVFFALTLFAQVPQGINYQAAIRKIDGSPLSNKEIKIRLSILNQSNTGSIIYREEHLVTTSVNGLISLIIGTGQNTYGQFKEIKWGNGLKYIKIDYSEDGSNNYQLSNTTLINSVPYAFYAENTNIVGGIGILIDGNKIINIGDSDNDPNNENQQLNLDGTNLSISNGNTIQLPNPTGILQIHTTSEILSFKDKPQGTMLLSSDNSCVYYYSGINWYKLEGVIQQNPNDIVVKDCLLAYYNFDKSDGSDYNGAYNGNINGVVFSTDVNGKINSGKSASFDGNDRITVPINPLKDLTQGTISFWIKSSATGIIIYGHTGLSTAFNISIFSNLGKKFVRFNESAYFNYDVTQFLNNNWNHFAITISNTERKLYVNGNLLELQTSNQGMYGTKLNNGMLIGENEYGQAYSLVGKFDNLRIHCKALTDNEVRMIYNAGQ